MKAGPKIAFMLCLALFLACGKEVPLEPPVVQIPELFPLAEGAMWVYNYEYYYYENNTLALPPVQITEYLTGKYTLAVKERQVFKDSIVYTLSGVTEPDTGSGGSVVVWEVMLHSDTLWYKLEGEWMYMMPFSFEPGGIDIRIFLPPIGRRYDLEKGTLVPGGSRVSDGYYRYDNAGNGLLADVNIDGVVRIEIFWGNGSMNLHPQWMSKNVWLKGSPKDGPQKIF